MLHHASVLGPGTSLDVQHKLRIGKLLSKGSALSDACLVHIHFGNNMIFLMARVLCFVSPFGLNWLSLSLE